MVNQITKYLTVDVTFHPEGMEVSCWMCPQRGWLLEVPQFPHGYSYEGDACTWKIHSNIDLTSKMVNMVCEYADRLCAKGAKKNSTRKLANR